jgi:hypothetical protein
MNYFSKLLILFFVAFFLLYPIIEVNFSEAQNYTNATIQSAVILHYDTYYPSIDFSSMHLALENALYFLQNSGFPMNKVMVITGRNTFDNQTELEWLMKTFADYGISNVTSQVGLYLPPEDAQNPNILSYALNSFNEVFRRIPYFVAGFSASSNTYTILADSGVKVSFFNLWEAGEDYSYRSHSTGDNLSGANWEGSLFQPYKPSINSSNVPGQNAFDEIDIWEAHWLTRNPSYAYFVVNSRNMGSIHPHDLLSADAMGIERCSSAEALDKLNTILDLIDYNSQYNQLTTVSYAVEVSFLQNSDTYEVWQNTVKQFLTRSYSCVDAVELRTNLESQNTVAPHTPIFIWYDNMTNSDLVVKGEHTPFAMVSSPYGRFIYSRRDPLYDSGSPLLSVVSYTTAKGFNASFQSIRELMGLNDLKMNTYVNDVPVEMRWTGDIDRVVVGSDQTITIRWTYSKTDVPYIKYNITTTLTPYGVLLDKVLTFTESVNASVSFVNYLNVQQNSPTPLSDKGTMVLVDQGQSYNFTANNPESNVTNLQLNNTLLFSAFDGYSLGVTIILGNPNSTNIIDEKGNSAYETLQFFYAPSQYDVNESIHLRYVFTPAQNLTDASFLAFQVLNFCKNDLVQSNSFDLLMPCVFLCLFFIIVATLIAKFKQKKVFH